MEDAHIFGVSVRHWSKRVVFCVGAAGVFICFLLDGMTHEHLINGYGFQETAFLTLVQFIGYAALSAGNFLELISGRSKLVGPLCEYLCITVCLAVSMGLNNYAAIQLSYATGVLFKSCKLIPVIVGNVIFLGRYPKLSEAIAVIFVVTGLIAISLADVKGRNKFDVSGIVAVSFSLIGGAIASNLEDKLMREHGASQSEVISMIYTLGSVVMAIIALVNGEFFSSFRRISNNKWCILHFICFGGLGAFGIQFVYLLMKVFGSLVTVMVTSVRKALTVCLSFCVFRDKVFTVWHGLGMIFVALGMGMNVMANTQVENQQEDEEALFADGRADTSEEV